MLALAAKGLLCCAHEGSAARGRREIKIEKARRRCHAQGPSGWHLRGRFTIFDRWRVPADPPIGGFCADAPRISLKSSSAGQRPILVEKGDGYPGGATAFLHSAGFRTLSLPLKCSEPTTARLLSRSPSAATTNATPTTADAPIITAAAGELSTESLRRLVD